MMQNQIKGRRFEARYESKARRILLPEFRFLTVRFITSATPPSSTGDSNPADLPEHEFSEPYGGYYPNFPVLIQGNGEPWDIGNLYLTQKLSSEHKYESRTYRAIADHLLDYLRFLEDEGLSYLHFPKMNQLKATYQYRRRLVDQVQAGEISVSTASARINAIIQFYRGIMVWKLIDEDLSMLEPFKDTQRYINTTTDFGISRSLRVRSHNLALATPRKQPQAEYVYDGGELRPLTMQEQEILLKSLLESSREYQLMFYFALFTGARIQSIGTLRIKCLKGRLDGDGYLRLPIGAGTEIDTKKGKRIQLLIPGWLIEDLLIYSKSQEASKRRLRSYYGDTEDNYVFLTHNGNPYYTSKKEILDRRDRQVSKYAGDEDRVHRSVTIQDGGTIRRYIPLVLLPRIRKAHPDFQYFTFHDLRATFGMNLMESRLKQCGDEGTTAALEYVQQRMGHSSKIQTMQYMNYRSRMTWKAHIQYEFEKELFKYVNSVAGKEHNYEE